MTRHETKLAMREQIRKTVERIRALKKERDAPGQPGWKGGTGGLELEQLKGLATLLCLARARARGQRHVVVLPRWISLPPGGRKQYGTVCQLLSQAALDELCDAEMAARFPGAALDPPVSPVRAAVNRVLARIRRPNLFRRLLAAVGLA